mmetsp:Transcript_11725/g.16213  ORF Transcript_11725/g.16213 Transcript_11725/m.16213 type:complete len:287 (-) Transcript_11725:513-1373(-)
MSTSHKRKIDQSVMSMKGNRENEKEPKAKIGKFGKFLAANTVQDLLKERKEVKEVITLQHNCTVDQALKILNKNKITSAPVVLAASVLDSDANDFMGIVDAGEILRKLCRETTLLEDIQKIQEQKLNVDEKIKDCEKAFETSCKEFWQRKLIQVCGQDVTLLPTVFSDTDLKTLISQMLFDKSGNPIHRVALLKQAEVKALVTQSDLLKFLHQHKGDIQGILKKKIEDIGLYDPKKGVVTVTSDTIAMEAFHKMFQKNISCLGIVSEKGTMLGNLSVSDLRVETVF